MKKFILYFSFVFTWVCLLFVLINLISLGLIRMEVKWKKKEPDYFSHLNLEAYTAGLNVCLKDSNYVRENLNDLLALCLKEPGEYQYYPGLEFTNRPFASKHINIISRSYDIPFRLCQKENSPSVAPELAYAIYCFGGSTTFGSLVSDAHTWPGFLSELLNIPQSQTPIVVKNYGTSGYTPTQETEKFLHLLKLGHRPSLAIFMDGVNTGPQFDGSEFSRTMAEKLQTNPDFASSLKQLINTLPVVKILQFNPSDYSFADGNAEETYPLEINGQYNDKIVNRFRVNARLRKKIGDLFGVKVINILQPSTFVYCPLEFLTQKQKSSITDILSKNSRILYQKLTQEDSLFISFDGLFNEYNLPPVTDGLHYSPGFNRFLAQKIIPYIDYKELNTFKLDTAAASGVPF